MTWVRAGGDNLESTLEDLELTTARTRPLEETLQVLSLGTVHLHQVCTCIKKNILTDQQLSGSFADREHRKWVEEAVVLPNNPYTTENIVRRWFLFYFFGCLFVQCDMILVVAIRGWRCFFICSFFTGEQKASPKSPLYPSGCLKYLLF